MKNIGVARKLVLSDHPGWIQSRLFRPSVQRRRQVGSKTCPFRPPKQQERRGDDGRLFINAAAAPIMKQFDPILPTAVIKSEAGGRLHLVHALLDPSSLNSMIDADVARYLRLERTFSGQHRCCSLILRGKYGIAEPVTTQAVVREHHVRITPSIKDTKFAATFQFMRLADPSFYVSSPTRVALGFDVYSRAMVRA